MKKMMVILGLAVLLLTALGGCSKRECMYCGGTDIDYAATFGPSGTREYLCSSCYQKYRKNLVPVWEVSPI